MTQQNKERDELFTVFAAKIARFVKPEKGVQVYKHAFDETDTGYILLCQKQGVDTFIPLSDRLIMIIGRGREDFERLGKYVEIKPHEELLIYVTELPDGEKSVKCLVSIDMQKPAEVIRIAEEIAQFLTDGTMPEESTKKPTLH